jgi:small subunit ribosomal protein S6
MRVYESTIAFHPDAGESAQKDLLERAKQAIAAEGGEVAQVHDWGLRDLAYPIKKQRRAAFHIIEFKGNGRAVAELERNLRIFDSVLRYITVQVDPDRPPLDMQRGRRDGADGPGEGDMSDTDGPSSRHGHGHGDGYGGDRRRDREDEERS